MKRKLFPFAFWFQQQFAGRDSQIPGSYSRRQYRIEAEAKDLLISQRRGYIAGNYLIAKTRRRLIDRDLIRHQRGSFWNWRDFLYLGNSAS